MAPLKKKILNSFCLVAIIVLFSACGGGGGGDSKTKPNPKPATNSIPTLTGSPLNTIAESQLYTTTLSISDADGDTVSVSVENLPAWANFNNDTLTISGTPSLESAGVYDNIKINADDGKGTVELLSFSITVENSIVINGKVIDGYIQGAVVFIDSNANLTLDDDELSATTDTTGSYSFIILPDFFETYTRSAILAYIGDGAVDLTRPELDFSQTPIVVSTLPLTTITADTQEYSQATVSPFTDKLAKLLATQLTQFANGEITKEALNTLIIEYKQTLFDTTFAFVSTDLTESALNIEQMIIDLFNDFIAPGNAIPLTFQNNLATIAAQALDTIIAEQDIRDSDNDGIPNNEDDDDDGDGVADADDLYPLDSAESNDNDGDGVGDNSDFYLNDAACYLESDGNGEHCYFTWMAANQPQLIKANGVNSFYFFHPDWSAIIEYNNTTGHFATPIVVENATTLEYSSTEQKLYVGFSDGVVRYVNSANQLESFIAVTVNNENPEISRITFAGAYIGIMNSYSSHLQIYNTNGELTDTSYIGSSNANFAWNESLSRLYYNSYSTLYNMEISQETGEIITNNYMGNYSNNYWFMAFSPSDEKLLTAIGQVFDLSDNTSLNNPNETIPQFGFWLDDETFVTLSEQADNSFLLQRVNNDFDIIEQLSIYSEVLATFSSADMSYIIVNTGQEIDIQSYLPSEDSDGDGVSNNDDKFPLDVAAAIDDDNDGAPDEWNAGYTVFDSTTNLTLDEFPLDSACWLLEHGDNGSCDYTATLPSFIPTKIIYDQQDDIYLLSNENNAIYRWSAATSHYTNPIHLATLVNDANSRPLVIAYSPFQNRIYSGYSNGHITYIDISDPAQEHNFATMSGHITSLNSAGDFLIAESSRQSYSDIFDADGTETDSFYLRSSNNELLWNSANNTGYSAQSSRIYAYQINQITGLMTQESSSDYINSYSVSAPIRFSADNNNIVTSNGTVFDLTLSKIARFENSEDYIPTVDQQWHSDALISVTYDYNSQNGNYQDNLRYWDQRYRARGLQALTSRTLAIAPNGSDIIIVSLSDDELLFSKYIIADHDSDTLPGWWELMHELDDANADDAALDPDDDGLSNMVEFALATDPQNSDSDNDGLSDGEEANTYNTDPLNNDSDGDGLSDGAEINDYGTNPLLADSDEDGLTDYEEVITYQSNPLLADSDEDGLLDLYEVENGLNPNIDDSQADLDNDGLINADEFSQNTDPRVADSDADGLLDGAEVHTHATDPLDKDSDDDRMYDSYEISYGFDPLSSDDANLDADSDSYSNMEEFFLDTDPSDINSVVAIPNWTMYQGNAGNTGFVPVYINSANITQRWEVAAVSQSRQVIASEGKAYFASYNASESVMSVQAINAANAQQLWQSDYDDIRDMSTFAVANNKVFISSRENSYYLRALDADTGTLFYRADSNYIRGYKYSPVPWGDALYLTEDRAIKAFDNSGSAQWDANYYTNSYYWSLALDEQFAYVPNNGLDIVDRLTGELQTHIAYPEESSVSNFYYNSPVIGTGAQVTLINYDHLYSFNTQIGSIAWQTAVDTNNNINQVAIAYGRIFTAQGDLLKVYDELTGELLWSWETETNNYITRDIVLTRNLAFVGTQDTTYAVDLASHETVWQTDIAGQMSISNEGALYIASNEKIVAFNIAGDSDSDGMADWWEDFYGFDKADASDAALDADSDGLTNLAEFQAATEPLIADSDSDGIDDGDEVNTYNTDPLAYDSDDDGISDGDEIDTHGTNPLSADSDSDGVNDYDEINVHGSNPLAQDTDGDGVLDGWEVQYGLDINNDDAQTDTDGDGLVNIDEQTAGTDPTNIDSDNDGLADGDEVHTQLTDPLAFDSDNDRMSDGWEVNHSLSPLDDSDANTDVDSDDFTNVEEYFLSTDPNDINDYASATPWVTFQGNARHDGFSLYNIEPDDIAQLWQIDLGYTPHQVTAASGKVFISNDSYFASHKIQTRHSASGELSWEIAYDNIHSIDPPAYANGTVFFQTGGHGDSYLRGVNANTGALEFESSYANQWSEYMAPTPFGDDIYISGGSYGGMYGFTQTGEEKFFVDLAQVDNWTPNVDENYVYSYTASTLKVFDRQTGDLAFSIGEDNRYGATPQAGVLGQNHNFVVTDSQNLRSFDLTSQTVSWEKTSNYLYVPAIAYGRIYVINDGVLEVIDERNGELLWSFEADEDLTQNIVITRNLVFVGSNSSTYAVSLSGHDSVWNAELYGHLTISEGVLYIAGNQTLSAFNIDGDDDEDGMPNWWESNFGLDNSDSEDAELDNDSDGLTNLLEFTHGADPTSDDSDNDGLTDGEEVHTYLSSPINIDTDQDGLSDGEEINTYSTNPILTDSDEDGFSDGDEVLIFATDPTDANSVPEAISSLTESFEDDTLPIGWSIPETSQADWALTTGAASDGSQSIRAGDIDDSQESIIEYQNLFNAGTLSFDIKVDSESCCDSLEVYLDDERQHAITTNTWTTYSIELESGLHVIKFRYEKDGSASSGEDSAWLDNIVFSQ